MKKMIIYILMLSGILILNSCSTSPVCVTSSITPLQGKIIAENLGKAEGKNTAVSILGLFMIGRPDLNRAIDNAVKSRGGDSLINVSCYETSGWFILFSTTTVKVEGEAVKFTADNSESSVKRKDKKR